MKKVNVFLLTFTLCMIFALSFGNSPVTLNGEEDIPPYIAEVPYNYC